MSKTLKLILAIIVVITPSTFGVNGRWDSGPNGQDVLSPEQDGRWNDTPLNENVVSPEETVPPPTTSTDKESSIDDVTTPPPVAEVTTTTTPQVVVPDCTMKNGFVGEIGKDSVSVALNFVYEMEINSASSKSIDDIIKDLEVGFAETAHPGLFSDDCRRQRRKLDVIGVSTLPAETVMQGATCGSEPTNTENPCYVVNSEFTTYTTNDTSESETREFALNAIQNAASNGDFATDDVVKVAIVDENTNLMNTNDNNNSNEFRTRSAEGGEPIGVTVYVVIAAGVLVILGGAIIYRRRKSSNQSNLDAASSIMPTKDTQDDEETPDLRRNENE